MGSTFARDTPFLDSGRPYTPLWHPGLGQEVGSSKTWCMWYLAQGFPLCHFTISANCGIQRCILFPACFLSKPLKLTMGVYKSTWTDPNCDTFRGYKATHVRGQRPLGRHQSVLVGRRPSQPPPHKEQLLSS